MTVLSFVHVWTAKRHSFALPDLALYARISVLWSANTLRRALEFVAAAFSRPADFDKRPSSSAVRVN